MKARAPGKVVLSGAYAVLEGAPAIVSAVSRYALADTADAAAHVTPEVRAAIGDRPAPAVDAHELFDDSGKLGLGASAAILVATLAAIELESNGPLADAELARRVLPWALDAHKRAQGGGSGIDVAASCHGASLLARIGPAGLEVESFALPHAHIEVWASGQPASTAALISRVRALSASDPLLYQERMAAQIRASEAAARARELPQLIEALAAQEQALAALGRAAGAEIVTAGVRELAALAAREAAVVLPSGAGGGDVALFVGHAAPSAALARRAAELGHRPLALTLSARGVHAVLENPS